MASKRRTEPPSDAHQLRNSLMSIISSAECLGRRLADDQHRKYLEDIIRTAREGAIILARIEASAADRRPAPALERAPRRTA